MVGQQDPDGLTKPKAFLVLRPDFADTSVETLREELKALAQERIGVWKYPRWVEVTGSLPKTATGKIQRFKLREGGA